MFREILILLNTAILLAVAGIYYLHFERQLNVAYVDALHLIDNYAGINAARENYRKQSAVWLANIDSMTREAEQALKDHKQNGSSMSSRERKVSEEVVQMKRTQLMDYQKAIQEKAAQANDEMTRQAIESINAYLKEYGAKKGYDIILTATEYGNIAFAADSMNITDDVLQGLNQQYAGQ